MKPAYFPVPAVKVPVQAAARYGSDQVTAPVISPPNSRHRVPSKRPICTCLTGAKSVGLVLISIPGNNIGTVKLCRFAACFITFSRVSTSPHCFSTCTTVAAFEGPYTLSESALSPSG